MEEGSVKRYTVNGFQFGSDRDRELAETEYSSIQYINGKIANRSAETILSVYQGAIERKMLRTPVGYAYLHDLQKQMVSMGLPREKIPPIPLMQVFDNSVYEEDRPRREVVANKRKKTNELREKNRLLIIANIILIVLVIALFAISLTGSTPNMLNYRSAIINEYSSWEQELSVREGQIREKEKELGISSTKETE